MNQSDHLNKIRKIITAYIGTVSTIIIPLYMKNGYFSLINAKATAYLYLMVPAIAAAAVAAVYGKLAAHGRAEGHEAGAKPGLAGIDPGVVLLLMIGLWSLISTFLSYNRKLSFWGTMGWSVGSFMTVVLISGSIILYKYFEFKPNMMIPVLAVNFFIFAIAVLQSAGVDVFGLWQGLKKADRFTYLSTIGQKNSFSGYLCLILPLFLRRNILRSQRSCCLCTEAVF